MKETIDSFIRDNKVAIVGASDNKENFGRMLMEELSKKTYDVFPVNPGYDSVLGKACVASVRSLPADVENVILAVPASLTGEIVDQCIGSPVKRVWMIKGMGRGSYTQEAHRKCEENGIGVVYGFCPMMFFGEGMHRFHFWLKKTFGKLPAEFLVSDN